MALARLGAGAPGLVALAGAGAAAGGGLVPWALWAVQVARDPRAGELAEQAGTAGAAAAAAAAAWVEEGHVEQVCLGRWQFYLLVGIGLLVLAGGVALCYAIACCCCPLGVFGFFGGRAWAHRRPPPPRGEPRDHHKQLADFISKGGQDAIQQAATELAVPPDAVREWFAQWQLVHRGPRRGGP